MAFPSFLVHSHHSFTGSSWFYLPNKSPIRLLSHVMLFEELQTKTLSMTWDERRTKMYRSVRHFISIHSVSVSATEVCLKGWKQLDFFANKTFLDSVQRRDQMRKRGDEVQKLLPWSRWERMVGYTREEPQWQKEDGFQSYLGNKSNSIWW